VIGLIALAVGLGIRMDFFYNTDLMSLPKALRGNQTVLFFLVFFFYGIPQLLPVVAAYAYGELVLTENNYATRPIYQVCVISIAICGLVASYCFGLLLLFPEDTTNLILLKRMATISYALHGEFIGLLIIAFSVALWQQALLPRCLLGVSISGSLSTMVLAAQMLDSASTLADYNLHLLAEVTTVLILSIYIWLRIKAQYAAQRPPKSHPP
jgi:hypothetical protein